MSLAVYLQTLGFDFLSNWDDYQYVTGNPDIRGFTAKNLARVFTSFYVGNYAPVHLLSYMLDYQVAGLSPAWFHGVNLSVHAANGILFYLLVQRLTGNRLWGFCSAAIFLLHPVQVESVAWVTERKNLLAMFFSLLSFLAYLSYRRDGSEKSRLWYALSLLSLLLALFSKSIAVVLPVAFLLHDLLLEGSPEPTSGVDPGPPLPATGGGRGVDEAASDGECGKGLWRDKIPFVAAAALVSGITLVTQSAEMGGGKVDFFEGDLWAKLLTMLTVLGRYLELLLWPTASSLNSVYILFIKSRFDTEVLTALLAAALLAVSGLYLLRRQRRLFFGFALFFLGLVPVSQIVPLATLMNDRYLYFPMLGAAWLAGGMIAWLDRRFPGRRINLSHAVVCLILVPCLLVSYQRCAVWRNAVALWSDVVQKYPTLKDQRAALAAAYIYDGQKEKALATYEELFALKRAFSDPVAEEKAYLETARLYLEKGEAQKALSMLGTLTAKYPGQPRGFLMLGDYHMKGGNLPEAEKAYRKVLQARPGARQALMPLAEILLQTGRVAEARSLYRGAVEAGGESPELHFHLARVEARAQDEAKALQHLAEALRLGYRDREAVTRDPYLAPLRRAAGFDALLATYFPAQR